jgi:hypothetical protein
MFYSASTAVLYIYLFSQSLLLAKCFYSASAAALYIYLSYLVSHLATHLFSPLQSCTTSPLLYAVHPLYFFSTGYYAGP